MEEMEGIALLMAAVAIVTAAFRRMGWNPVLGLIAAGIALGPNGFKLVAPEGGVSHMAEIGILFLLFIIGVELSADRIRAMARYIFGLGGLHFLVSGALIGGLAFVVGETLIAAIVLGVALAMSSTAFVLQTLADTGQMTGAAGRKSFAVLLFQDIMVAPILAAIPLVVAIVGRQQGEEVHHTDISLPVAAVAMMIIFVVSRLVLQQLIGFIHAEEAHHDKKSHEGSSYFLAAVVAVALLMGVAAHHLGLSASLGAFLAGLALSGGEWRHDVRTTVKPLESTFLGIFFISLGAQVPLSATPASMALMAAAAVAIIGLKVAAGFLASVANGLDRRTALRIGIILAQAGEFAFVVLASAGAAALSKETADFWAGAAVISLVATPILVTFAGRLNKPDLAAAALDTGEAPASEPVPAAEQPTLVIAGHSEAQAA